MAVKLSLLGLFFSAIALANAAQTSGCHPAELLAGPSSEVKSAPASPFPTSLIDSLVARSASEIRVSDVPELVKVRNDLRNYVERHANDIEVNLEKLRQRDPSGKSLADKIQRAIDLFKSRSSDANYGYVTLLEDFEAVTWSRRDPTNCLEASWDRYRNLWATRLIKMGARPIPLISNQKAPAEEILLSMAANGNLWQLPDDKLTADRPDHPEEPGDFAAHDESHLMTHTLTLEKNGFETLAPSEQVSQAKRRHRVMSEFINRGPSELGKKQYDLTVSVLIELFHERWPYSKDELLSPADLELVSEKLKKCTPFELKKHSESFAKRVSAPEGEVLNVFLYLKDYFPAH